MLKDDVSLNMIFFNVLWEDMTRTHSGILQHLQVLLF